jgi:hypothetical protein
MPPSPPLARGLPLVGESRLQNALDRLSACGLFHGARELFRSRHTGMSACLA